MRVPVLQAGALEWPPHVQGLLARGRQLAAKSVRVPEAPAPDFNVPLGISRPVTADDPLVAASAVAVELPAPVVADTPQAARAVPHAVDRSDGAAHPSAGRVVAVATWKSSSRSRSRPICPRALRCQTMR